MQYTLAQLRARVAREADVEFAAGARHTVDAADDAVNDALAEYWLVLTDCGHPQRSTLGSATTATGTADADGWPANSHVVIGTDVIGVLGVWRVEDSHRIPLDSFDEQDTLARVAEGRPERYRLARNTADQVIIRLHPPADASYTIEWIAVPEPPTLDADGDTVDLHAGTVDMVVCQAALAILRADGVPEGNQFAAIQQRRDAAEAKLRHYAKRMNRGPSGQRRDTRRQYGRAQLFWDYYYGRGL